MTLKVCVAGVTGWTGKAVAQGICATEDMSLVSAVSRSSAGKSLRELDINCDSDVIVAATVEEALAQPVDVFVDYTSAAAVKEHAMYALNKGVAVIVGSSGLTAEDYTAIEKLATSKNIGVIACGNFSITAALAKHFALLAAEYLPSWEILDYAGSTKMDAPSGTTRELAECLEAVRQNKLGREIKDVVGDSAARGAQVRGTPIHSLRLPGYVLSFETIFGLPEERLTVRHDAGTSALPYVDGTLLALRQVGAVNGLIRGLDQLMFGKR
ncbi:4-hydroxy-tetrahydrodipicolinate reductase [bacterium]|nr:4-hydroxy-tetrahydrodipicolinate reductase [bacterium]MBP9807285.1 4-hydroxy-tetrahydrodipicolinate reductase [bacterium]